MRGKFCCVFGCAGVDLGGVDLSLSFLAFGKDLNDGTADSMRPRALGILLVVQTRPAQSSCCLVAHTLLIPEDPRTGGTGDDKPTQLDVDGHHHFVILSFIMSAVLSCEQPTGSAKITSGP